MKSSKDFVSMLDGAGRQTLIRELYSRPNEGQLYRYSADKPTANFTCYIVLCAERSGGTVPLWRQDLKKLGCRKVKFAVVTDKL